MKGRGSKRLISVLLSLVMLLSLLPTTVFAEGEDTTAATWSKVALADIAATDTVAITMTKDSTTWVLPNSAKKQPMASTGTVADGKLTTSGGADQYGWTISAVEGGYHIKTGTSYLYLTAANNGMRIGSTEMVWSLSSDGYLTAKDSNSVSRYLGVYNGQDWRCYTNTTGNIAGQTLAFYKLDESAGGSTGGGSTVTVEAPTANHPTGSALTSGTEIVFACATADAAIQYKVGDGAYQPYTAPIALTADTTFTVKATKEGMTDSAEVTFAYTVRAAEPAYVTIAEALAGASKATFTVKGVITLVDGSNYYLQDDTGGICLRLATSTNDIALGDTVIGTGKRADYNGLPQLGSGTFVKSSGLTLTARATTIGALTTADIGTYVKLTGLEITDIYDNNGTYKNPNITLKDAEGKTIQLYKAVINKADGSWEYAVGDKVDVTAAVSVFAKNDVTTLQLRNTKAEEVTKARQSGIVTSLSDGDTVVIFNPANNKALSSEYKGGFYNQGTDVTLADGKLTGYTAADIWTVGVNADGTYTFSTADGKKLSMGAKFTSTPLDDVNTAWKVTPAKTADCFYIQNAARGNYIEWYADKSNWSSFGNIGSNEALFAQQFYLVVDDGSDTPDPGGLPAEGAQVVLYNQNAKAALAAQDSNTDSPSITKSGAAEITDGKFTKGNGAAVFTVEKNGEYYRFYNKTYGYLCSNGTGNNAFYSQTASNDADWLVRTCSGDVGGFEMESRTAKYNDKYSQWLEYYADSFKTYSMYNVTDYTIYSFYFYPVEGTTISDGVVNKPTVDFGTVLPAYVGQDYELTFTVDAPFGVKDNKMTARLGGDTLTVTLGEDGTYTATIPTALVTGDKLTVTVSGTDNKYIPIYGTVEIEVKDEPVITDPTPSNGFQTGDDKRPTIGATIGNAGTDPTVTLKVGGETVKAEYNNGKVTYTPAADMKDGRVDVELTVTRKDGKTATLNWYFTVGKTQYQMYFGQLHGHTQYSDGSGSLTSALEYVKNLPDSANVDFVAFTDHSNYFDSKNNPNVEAALYDTSLVKDSDASHSWATYKKTIADFNASQSDIIAIGGFEMTWSGGPGHINTFNSPGVVSRNNTTLNNKTSDAGMKAYYALLSQQEGANTISQFNHPGTTFGNFSDFSYWDPVIDTRMYMVEVGNGEGQIGAGGYYPSYEQYIMALDKGWHVAPTNNQDNHKGKWGNANDARDVIITDNFTEEGIYEAIRAMRMYATEDKNLELGYTVNGQMMGSSITVVPDKLNINVTFNDPDKSDSISKVEIVVNSGKVVQTWDTAAELASGNLSVELKPDYSYYFVRVTQGDGDLAVTAPVWVGETLKLGISNVACGTSTPVTGEELTLTTTLFNSEAKDATIKSLTYAIKGGEVIGTDKTERKIAASSTLDVEFKYTPDKARATTITVTAVVVQDGKDYTFTKDIALDVLDAASLVYIGIDAAHYNEYVAGNYKDSMGNFGNLAAGYSVRTVELKTSADLINACSNAKYKALILTAPSRRLADAQTDPRTYTAAELAAITAFNAKGGTVILAGWSDNYENYDVIQNNPAIKHMAAAQNELLAALGSSLRISDDATYDDVRSAADGVDKWRLYFSTYNMDNLLLAGVEVDADHPYDKLYTERFSHYGGASIYAVDADGKPTSTLPATVSPAVYGHATTYSIDVDKDGLGGAGTPKYAYADNDSRLMVMATEQLPGKGMIVVSGAAFMSNFEVQATISDNGSEKNYSNYKICENLIRYLNPVTITDIKDVQAEKDEGVKFTVEGIVTSNASGYDKSTAFFDCIYVQDGTAGINCFPVAGEFKVGDKVRITGTTSSYQGERQLAVTSIKKIGEETPVTPKTVTAAQINDGSVLGSLVKIKGTVTRIENAEGLVQTIMVKDSSGKEARVFIDGYITTDKGIGNLKVGCNIEAVGLASWDNTFALDGTIVAPRIRIRDRADIVCTKAPTGGGGSGSGGSSSSGSSAGSSTPSKSFTTDLPSGSITGVFVNGKKLDSKYYVISGNTVTLTEAYMSTLKPGTYTIKIENATHVSTATFTVTRSSSPGTADPGMVMYVAMAVASVTGMAWLGKRKED